MKRVVKIIQVVNYGVSDFDLAIRIGQLPDSSLISRKITELDIGLYASQVYLSQHPAIIQPSDLVEHQLFSMREQEWTLFKGKEKARVQIAPRMLANSVGMLISLVRGHGGIAPWPPALVNTASDDDVLMPVLPGWSFARIPVYAITETRLLPAKTRLFIQYLVEQFRVG